MSLAMSRKMAAVASAPNARSVPPVSIGALVPDSAKRAVVKTTLDASDLCKTI
jgi:hypothetical protein